MANTTRLPNFTYLYFFCQSINLMAAVISVAVTATVGNKLAVQPVYATIPYGFQFLFLFIATYPASMFMKHYGRKAGFYFGAGFLFMAGVVGYYAIVETNFLLLVLAHSLIGLFSAFANFYRYAVTDGLDKSIQSKALSLVVAGGVIAGILGPTISNLSKDIANLPQFSMSYGVLSLFAILNIFIIYFLPDSKNKDNLSIIQQKVVGNYNTILIAIIVAAVGYGLMNLLMIQSSLQMNNMTIRFKDSALAIQWHVVAMFLPSFFTGILITKFGHIKIVLFGFVLFAICFILNIWEISYNNIAISLVLLGLGWNFTYVAGSALLAYSLNNSSEKQKWQGIGDTTIAIFATMGAMFPSILLTKIGWEYSNILAIFICVICVGTIYIFKIFKTKTFR